MGFPHPQSTQHNCGVVEGPQVCQDAGFYHVPNREKTALQGLSCSDSQSRLRACLWERSNLAGFSLKGLKITAEGTRDHSQTCVPCCFSLFWPDSAACSQGPNPRPLQWKHSLNHWATRQGGSKCLNLRIPRLSSG